MLYDSLALCKFTVNGGIGPTKMSEWLYYTTGIKWTADELMECGERIFTKKKIFNVSCGLDRKDDYLPERTLKEKRGSGGAAENLPPLSLMLDDYYEQRGWTNNGIPTKDKLSQLGIY